MNQKGFAGIFVLILVLVVAVAGGAYYLGRTTTKPQVNKTNQTTPTPTLDPTTNWKTYTNTIRGYTFKYPATYTLKEIQGSQTQREGVYLQSEDIELTGNYQVTGQTKGANIGFSIFDTGEDSYKRNLDSYGQKQIETTIGGKDAFLINLRSFANDSQTTVIINVPLKYGFLSIEFTTGDQDTQANQDNYLKEFNQILSTFKFTN